MNANDVTVGILPNDSSSPAGKVCDAELRFGPEAGCLAGLKLVGFAVWERRGGGGRSVTFPARTYAVNGERRSFALLRPIADAIAQDAIRGVILAALEAYELAATAGEGERRTA